MTTIFGLRGTDEQIDVLRARLLATRWPSYDSRDDWSLGTSSDDAKRLAQYWATQFDFDSLRQRLAALPHEFVIIDVHDGWKRGIRIGNVSDGTVVAFIPDPVEKTTGTSAAEGVATDEAGNIYGAEVGPKRLMRYVKN